MQSVPGELVILSKAKDLPLNPEQTTTQKHPRLIGWITLTGLMLFLISIQAMGQGCAQCIDSTRATPLAVQAAYRHAIILLGGFGAAFFLAGTLLLRRMR